MQVSILGPIENPYNLLNLDSKEDKGQKLLSLANIDQTVKSFEFDFKKI